MVEEHKGLQILKNAYSQDFPWIKVNAILCFIV